LDLNSGNTNFAHLVKVVKVRGVVFLNHEDVWANDRGVVPSFLTVALDGGERPVSLPCNFIPRERAVRPHWIGGWVGPGTYVDIVNYSSKRCKAK
jgi:hypothetical protein